MNIGDILFQLLPIALFLLFFISLAAFIKSMLKAQQQRALAASRVEGKLDRIIELLEKDREN